MMIDNLIKRAFTRTKRTIENGKNLVAFHIHLAHAMFYENVEGKNLVILKTTKTIELYIHQHQ